MYCRVFTPELVERKGLNVHQYLQTRYLVDGDRLPLLLENQLCSVRALKSITLQTEAFQQDYAVGVQNLVVAVYVSHHMSALLSDLLLSVCSSGC